MTINLGQFGGVFWHDDEGNEQEVVNPNNDKPVQGMLFHPLTGTGIPGDPLQTKIGRERDVRNAFGFSVPDIEKSGIPRDLLGSQETNPTVERMDGRKKNASGAYQPDTNTIFIRPEDHPTFRGEAMVHELGHARDRDRMKNTGSAKGVFTPEYEGTADAFNDRFSEENIMRPSGSFDPLVNPGRAAEIMKEPIEKINRENYLRGYGGNSYAWRDKVEQATYAISRMLGAMRPSGLPARRAGVGTTDVGLEPKRLSGLQLTATQAKQKDFARTEDSWKHWEWSTRGDLTAERTVHIGRLYKYNPHVKALLDGAGLQDLGEFATHVHSAYVKDRDYRNRLQVQHAVKLGDKYDDDPTSEIAQNLLKEHQEGVDRYGKIPTAARKAFLQPSLFGSAWEKKELDIPKVTTDVPDIDSTEDAKAFLKQRKIKKPGKRAPSEWKTMMDANKQKRIESQRGTSLDDLFRF